MKSLFRCRSVCKEWRSFIDDPSFIESHTNSQHSSNTLLLGNATGDPLFLLSLDSLDFNDDDHQAIDAIRIKQLICRGLPQLGDLPVALCNGLILMSDDKYNKIWAIWNPLMRECHQLPPIPYTDLFFVGRGLGYDRTADEYKVVGIDFQSHSGFDVLRTLVYSMKSGSWRIVGDCPHRLTGSREGIFLNGALHWLSHVLIIVFDIKTEDYCQLALPQVSCRNGHREVYLNALGECLSVSYYYHDEHFDVWVMNDYGVEQSWVKLFSLEKIDIVGGMEALRPVAYVNGKRQVLMQNGYWGLYVVDVENNSVRKVTIHGHPCISSAQICPKSLFRFGDSGNAAPTKTSGTKRMRKNMGTSITRLTFCVKDVENGWLCSDSESED